MLTNLKIPSNYKRILLITSENSLVENMPFIDFLDKNNIESNVYVIRDHHQDEKTNDTPPLPHKNINFLTSWDRDKLQAIFNQQLIGTRLFISGPWSLIHVVKEVANDTGFSDDEIQYEAVGAKEEKVYCVNCYSFNKKQESNVLTCEHCQKELEVATNFYSKRLDAYLGYIKIG